MTRGSSPSVSAASRYSAANRRLRRSSRIIAWSWETQDGQRRVIAVNYAGNQSQCYVRFPFPDLSGRAVRLKDLMGPASYDRDGTDLVSRGHYLDLPPWSFHVFEVLVLP